MSFSYADGTDPESPLIQAKDGSFYGTTYAGGTYYYGTAFKLTSAGLLSAIVNFSGANGQYPTSALIQGVDGNLYGTTGYGAPATGGHGSVFKIIDIPQVTGGSVSTTENVPVAFGLPYLDPLGYGFSTSNFSFPIAPAFGTAYANSTSETGYDGIVTFVYSPKTNFFCIDSFTYIATDGYGNSSNIANVTVTVTAAIFSCAVVPNAVTLGESSGLTFGVTARDPGGKTFTPSTITWSVPSAAGTITPEGYFVSSTSPGTYTLTATASNPSVPSGGGTIKPAGYIVSSVGPGTPNVITAAPLAGSSSTVTARITVLQLPVNVTVSPGAIPIAEKATQVFTASVKDAAGVAFTPQSLKWTVPAAAGTITSGGVFTAGTTPGTYKLTAVATSYGVTQTGIASITVALSVPYPPTALAASGVNRQIALTWQKPLKGHAPTGYNVYRGTVAGGESSKPINGASPIPASLLTYTDSSVVAGKAYYYVVRAVNTFGSSKPSNETTAVPAQAVVPSAATGRDTSVPTQ